jgi:hypothetical protein
MIGLGDVRIREASTIRFIQATTAGLQGISGMALFGDLVPAKVAGGVILVAAFFQFWLAAWNSGLHNQPEKPYEPPRVP